MTPKSDKPSLAAEERRDLRISLWVALGIPIILGFFLPAFGSALLFVGLPLLVGGAFAVILGKAFFAWQTEQGSLLRETLGRLRPASAGMPTGEDFFAEGFRWTQFPWVTVVLIAVNAALFYVSSQDIDLYTQKIDEFSLAAIVRSMFMHVNAAHLWGNMLFLWAFGSLLEPRIGGARYFLWYLVCGLAAGLVSLVGYRWILGLEGIEGVGASGAISGVMGLALVRCYFAKVSIGVPILGGAGWFLPVSLRVSVNLMFLVALFFFFDMLGTRLMLAQGDATSTGYWAHVGGYLAGLAIGYRTGLFREGLQEKLRVRAMAPRTEEKPSGNRDELIALVEREPENLEAVLQLARLEARPFRKLEGDTYYRRAIDLLQQRDPRKAGEIYLEYYRIYGGLYPPDRQLFFSQALHRQGEFDLAARTLEESLKHHPAGGSQSEAGREKALFFLGKILTDMGLAEAATTAYQKLLQEFPQTELREVAQARLSRIESQS